jgi:tRNA dimethylallyltransferase
MRRVIVVAGATGTGKSQLAIHLAQRFKGEIINADAMQLYRGLNVVTNKIGLEERCGIKHHLLDVLELDKEYTVINFVKDVDGIVADVHARDKIPIIVGGTHYYIQSYLWSNSLNDQATAGGVHASLSEKIVDEIQQALKGQKDLYSLLQDLDPEAAKLRHRNETRKISRALEVYLATGKPAVKLEQHLKFPTCAFWLYTDPQELDLRLDSRVDKMSKEMWPELRHIRDLMKQNQVLGCVDGQVDWTRGVLQTIGLKEFSEYLDAFETDCASSNLSALKEQGLEEMKRATRRYAKTQVSWLQNKLGPKLVSEWNQNRQSGMWMLDSTDLSLWGSNVIECATSIVQAWLEQDLSRIPHPISPPLGSLLEPRGGSMSRLSVTERGVYTCDICVDKNGFPKEVIGLFEWEKHLNCRQHVATVARLKKLDENPYYRNAVMKS